MWRWILLAALGAEPATVLPVSADATLSLPAQVQHVKDASPLPAELSKSVVYRLPDGTFLMLNVTAPGGAPCTFERQKKQLEELKQSSTVGVLHYFPRIEERRLGDFPAFYVEGGSRTQEEAQQNIPFHVRASYSVCLRDSMLGLTVMKSGGAVSTEDIATLNQIASSLRHPGKAAKKPPH